MANLLNEHEAALAYFKPHIPRFREALAKHAQKLLISVRDATIKGENVAKTVE